MSQDKLIQSCVEIRDIPGKGNGLFAKKAFGIGDVILAEAPLIVMPDDVFSHDDMDRIEAWLDRQINKLTSDQRSVFFDLSDFNEEKSPLGVFFTNDMTFGKEDAAAIFPTMARANHACQPNADFVSRDEFMEMIAVKKIAAGEEITLSYLPAADVGSDVRAVRRNYLRRWYGFQCLCRTCTSLDEAFEENEALRRRLRSFQLKSEPKLSDFEMHLVDMIRAETKLPHQLKVSGEALTVALDECDETAAVAIATKALINAEVVGGEEDVAFWEGVRDSTRVQIDGQIHLFPPM